jgi:hypothetical protein
MAESITTGWQAFEDEDGFEYHRAILENYIVFLRSEPPAYSKAAKRQSSKKQNRDVEGWFVHILMPEDERQKAFLAGPGFDRGVRLEEAKRIAENVARDGRGKLERLSKRQELEARGNRQPKSKKRR